MKDTLRFINSNNVVSITLFTKPTKLHTIYKQNQKYSDIYWLNIFEIFKYKVFKVKEPVFTTYFISSVFDYENKIYSYFERSIAKKYKDNILEGYENSDIVNDYYKSHLSLKLRPKDDLLDFFEAENAWDVYVGRRIKVEYSDESCSYRFFDTEEELLEFAKQYSTIGNFICTENDENLGKNILNFVKI